MNRRRFLRSGLIAAGALRFHHLLQGPSSRNFSPHLAPYVDSLPIPQVLKPRAGEQLEIKLKPGMTRVHRDLAPTRIWGYDGTWPGPTIEARSGHSLSIHWKNSLPGDHMFAVDHTIHGAGSDVPDVRTVTHLHGARVLPEDDGYPDAWISPHGRTGPAYNRKPSHYPNEQAAGTLWYHDHAIGITRLNIYAGLAGLYVIRDDAEDRLQLPSGAYEIPLILQDRSFNSDGSLFYPVAKDGTHPVWVQQFFGEINCVNGKACPYLEVEPRKYRFRMLNGSNSRFYQLLLELTDSNGKRLNRRGPTIYLIGTDVGLLPAPVAVNPLTIAPAERCDIVIDFAGHANESFAFINGGNAPFGTGGEIVPSDVILFRVNKPLLKKDDSQLPRELSARESLISKTPVRERILPITESVRASDRYTIIGLLGDKRWSDPISEDPRLGSTEIWSLVNVTEEAHPIHLHLAHFELINRQLYHVREFQQSQRLVYTGQPEPPADWERGAVKDTVIAHPEYVTRIAARFAMPARTDARPGQEFTYVWHCHILEHEDNEMMRPFKVLASTTSGSESAGVFAIDGSAPGRKTS